MTAGKMKKSSLLLAAAFAFAGVPAWASRPMSEMEGGCENFAMPLAKEMSLWDKSELRVQGAQDDKSTAILPAERKVSLSLYPQKKVVLPVKPEKDFAKKAETAFAGLAAIQVPKDGTYRISLGSKVWLDLVAEEGADAGPKLVPAANFEMQTGCAKIFKAVEYNLKAGKKYYLQISSSQAPSAHVLTSFVK
jgi:hypothetical protein